MIFLFKPSLPQRRMVSPAGRRGSDLPRLILIFVASKKNGFACSSRRERRQGQDAMKAA